MTCDDVALHKDGTIQKEMKFEIKPVVSGFKPPFKNFIQTIDTYVKHIF